MSIQSLLVILVSLAISVAISFLVTPYVIKLALKIDMLDVPRDKRRMHDHPVPLLGGISIIVAFFATVLTMAVIIRYINFNGLLFHRVMQILPGALIVSLMAFFDDKYNLPAAPRLVIQCAAAGIAVAMGVRITQISGSVTLFHTQVFALGPLSVPITILWIVGITNAVNWIDGLDGLAAGISSIASVSMMFIAVFTPEYRALSIAVLAACLAGSCIGFLPYNKNPAKVFMGDTGAMFLGFTLAVISIQGAIKIYTAASLVLPLIILGLPLFDTASAILRRIAKGKSPMAPDRSHIHHKLIDLGLSQKNAVLFLYIISTCLGILGVLFSVFSPMVGWRFLGTGILSVLILSSILIWLFKRKTRPDPPQNQLQGGHHMDELLKILHDIDPDVDFTKEKNLVGKHILDSLSLVMLVPDLEEAFDVNITPVDLVPENFESADTIYAMITRLQGNG